MVYISGYKFLQVSPSIDDLNHEDPCDEKKFFFLLLKPMVFGAISKYVSSLNYNCLFHLSLFD